MKVLNLFIIALKAQVENQGDDLLKQQEIQAKMTVTESEHKLCNFDEIPDEFDCHKIDNFARCSAACSDGSLRRRRCECYKKWMFISIYE